MDDPTTAGLNLQCLCLTTQNYTSVNQTCLSFGTYGDACNSNGRACETRYGRNII